MEGVAFFFLISTPEYRAASTFRTKTTGMDASVSKLVDAYADNVIAAHNADKAGADQPEELDVDAMFDQLESEDDGVLRERRLAQLHRE